MTETQELIRRKELEDLLVEITYSLANRSDCGSWWNDPVVYDKVKKVERVLGRRLFQ